MAVTLTETGVEVVCAGDTTLAADVLVVASGNADPAAWPRISDEARASGRFFDSAWTNGAMTPRRTDEHVLLLGTGLTSVDAVLGLRYNGHRGKISMISRRGLLPHEHRLFDRPPEVCPEANSLRDLTAALRESTRRARGAHNNWRTAIDGVRPQTNALWGAMPLDDKKRFVRHILPYWNVHRHRMAPEVAKTIAELIADGTVTMIAGYTRDISASGEKLIVPVGLRGGGEVTVEADRIINCSGPEHDVRNLPNPLLRQLLAAALIVPHPLQIGIQVAPDGALIGTDGKPSDRLFAIGPIRFGTLIETVAIPEVRVQAQELAQTLVDVQTSVPASPA